MGLTSTNGKQAMSLLRSVGICNGNQTKSSMPFQEGIELAVIKSLS